MQPESECADHGVGYEGVHGLGCGCETQDIVVSEDCPKSQNEWGTHHNDWYEDEGCPWCGTTEPNLIIIGGDE